MFDYYHYFAEKGNHPDEKDVLQLEKNIDLEQLKTKKDQLLAYMISNAPKAIGIRIIIDGKEVLHYLNPSFDEQADEWLARKEKVVNETGHSSYYVFLDNMKTHNYEYMIDDESYAICGGGFPLYSDGKLRGTFAVTGCRPDEDHQVIIDALKNADIL